MTVTGRGAIMAVWHHGGVLAFHSPWAAAWCCAGLPEVMLPCAQRGQRCSARTRAGLPVPACTNPPSALACMQIPRLHRMKGWLPPKLAPALAPHLPHNQLAAGSSASLSRSLQLGTQTVVIRFLVSTSKWSKGFISDAATTRSPVWYCRASSAWWESSSCSGSCETRCIADRYHR